MKRHGQRIDWQPWRWSTRTWLLVLTLSLISSPFVSRWVYLQQISDVRLPFDLDEFSNRTVPDDENAFKVYTTAAEMFRSAEGPWLGAAIDEVLVDHEKWDDRMEDWLQQNQTLFATLERATRMEQSQDEPACVTRRTSVVQLATEVNRFRDLMQVEVLRCIRNGDFQRAWEWQQASLRFGRHLGMNGYPGAISQRQRFRDAAYKGIAYWAAHSEVSVEQLQRARIEIAVDLSATNPISELLKFTYVMVKNDLESEDSSKMLYPEWNRFPQYGILATAWDRWHFWTIGEPEVSLRLLRQVLVNRLSHADDLPWDRPPEFRREYPSLFDVSSIVAKQPGQLSSAQLAKLMQDPTGQRLIRAELFNEVSFDNSAGLDGLTYAARTSGFMIDVVLASYEYQRKFGAFPASLEDLIPTYLDKIPLDEFDRSRSPIHYRRQNPTDAVIWSVGEDRVDDGGNIDQTLERLTPDDQGFRLRIVPGTR